MRSVTVNLTTFEPKQCKQQACEAKAQNGWTTVLLELECENKGQNALETSPVGLQEGAGGLSFTVLCFPKGMHRSPRDRDNHTAAVLYEKLKKTVGRDENLFIVSVNKAKTNVELIWAKS